jgi:S-(hydroxymethyl)glutathione dehydrogenase / alcohol dehydrogenase
LELAAMIGCAVTTGVGAVRSTARVRMGQSVVVVGCGGIGSNVVHAAAAAGAYPIVAVDVVPAKFGALRALGATHCVDATAPGARAEIAALTGGADYAFVTSSAAGAFPTAFTSLGPRGTCVLIAGYPDNTTVAFDPGFLLNGERRIIASKYGSANPPVDFPGLVELYLAGRLPLEQLVSGRWGIGEVDAAYDALRRGQATRGLIVFEVTS